MRFSCFSVLPGSAEAHVNWDGILKCFLTVYFTGNISAKKYQNVFTNVKVTAKQKWDVFWDTVYVRIVLRCGLKIPFTTQITTQLLYIRSTEIMQAPYGTIQLLLHKFHKCLLVQYQNGASQDSLLTAVWRSYGSCQHSTIVKFQCSVHSQSTSCRGTQLKPSSFATTLWCAALIADTSATWYSWAHRRHVEPPSYCC